MATNQPVDLGIRGIADAVEIGRGGFAVVYRAFQPAFDRFVAVKVLDAADVDDLAQVAFQRECRAIGKLSGRSNILMVHEAGLTATGKPYLVMALATESLEDGLNRRGPLPVPEVVGIVRKVAWALEFAHQAGILHRDVKPANILVSDDGEPQLADFGIALVASATRHGRTGLAFTPAHAPPEAFENLPLTSAADVYSLASTMFNLIAGHPPFVEHPDESPFVVMARVNSAPVPDLRSRGVPDPLCRVMENALEKEPAKRPRSAAAFAAGLEAADGEGKAGVPPYPGPAPRLPRTVAKTPPDRAAAEDAAGTAGEEVRRRRHLAVLAVVIVLVAALAVALVLRFSHAGRGALAGAPTSTSSQPLASTTSDTLPPTSTPPAAPAGPVFLDAIPPTNQTGVDTVQVGVAKLSGHSFSNSILFVGDSGRGTADFQLPGPPGSYKVFSATIGLDVSVPQGCFNGASFEVFGDGRRLLEESPERDASRQVKFAIPVQVSVLVLTVQKSMCSDPAVWGDAQVSP